MNGKRVNGVLIKSEEQIAGVRRAGKLAAELLHYMGGFVKPGISTEELDKICREYVEERGAVSATLGYKGYPKSVCISLNNVVCHGIPSPEVILADGDIVNIDVTPILDGYFGDTNFTFFCGEVSEARKRLVQTAKEALAKGMEQVKPGNYLSNIGFKIQKFVEKRGFSVVRDYTGHGVGVEFHEAPTVLHYGRPNRGIKLLPGMIFTIEPMVNAGTYEVLLDRKDGWTVYTRDGRDSAQFEHTILVTEDGCEVLTGGTPLWDSQALAVK
jgi:methionyl aminopeptidase